MSTTNSYKIAITLTVRGEEHDFLAPFGAQPALTTEAFTTLPEPERLARENAFYDYLQGLYGEDIRGYVKQGYEARILDPSACPIMAYFRLTVQATNGTATLAGLEKSSGSFPAGTGVPVSATPDNPNRPFEGWFDGEVKVLGNPEDTYPNLGKDTLLEARFGSISTFTVLVENLDGWGTVSGGGTVQLGDSVFISSVNSDAEGHRFSGWYVKGTDTRVATGENAYYTPNPAHADAGGTITLVATYTAIPAQLTAVFRRQEPSAGAYDRFYYALGISRRVGCLVTATLSFYTKQGAYLGSGQLSLAPGSWESLGEVFFDYPIAGDPDFNVSITEVDPEYCGDVPVYGIAYNP